MAKRKRKRTEDEIEQLAADFAGRLDYLEQAWGCRVEYEVDLGNGAAWFRIDRASETVALIVRCDVSGVSLPATKNLKE